MIFQCHLRRHALVIEFCTEDTYLKTDNHLQVGKIQNSSTHLFGIFIHFIHICTALHFFSEILQKGMSVIGALSESNMILYDLV